MFILFVLIVCSISTCAIDFGANILATTISMSTIGDMIDLYNDVNDSDIRPLSSALGAEFQGSVSVNPWLSANIGVSLQGAQTGTDREKVTTTLLGLFAGPQIYFGAWFASVELGLNRTSFSFPASFYESLRGWSMGVSSSIGYSFGITQTLTAEVATQFQWIPVYRLRDPEGGVYQARDGAFLSYTGIGLSIGITWKR